jgi:hypothetical protein
MPLYATLDHYEEFTQSCVTAISSAIETPLLVWGLPFLVIKAPIHHPFSSRNLPMV